MSNPKSSTWSNLLHSDNPEPARAKEGPSSWDKVAATLAGVGTFLTEFATEQIYAAGQDFVSRVLLGETAHGVPREPDRTKDRDDDKDLER
jgi:hypothetical protein